MLPPEKPRNQALEDLIRVTGQRISWASTEEWARMAAHEYDEEVVTPPEDSPGRAFLHATCQTFVRWINREDRLPAWDETDAVAAEVTWHREAPGSQVAQAFVDLGLFYSHHADAARGATVADFQRVLNAVAQQLIFTLTEEHAPLV